MNPQIRFLTVFLSITVMAFGQASTKRYLYMSTPDASQKEGRAGNGILIFDIDNGHKFVRRINIPIFEEGIRLTKLCSQRLNEAERRVNILVRSADSATGGLEERAFPALSPAEGPALSEVEGEEEAEEG